MKKLLLMGVVFLSISSYADDEDVTKADIHNAPSSSDHNRTSALNQVNQASETPPEVTPFNLSSSIIKTLFDDTSLEAFDNLTDAFAQANNHRILDDEAFSIFKDKTLNWFNDIKLAATACFPIHKIFKIAQGCACIKTKQYIQQSIRQYQAFLQDYIKYCDNIAKKNARLEEKHFIWSLHTDHANPLSFCDRSQIRRTQLAYTTIVLFSRPFTDITNNESVMTESVLNNDIFVKNLSKKLHESETRYQWNALITKLLNLDVSREEFQHCLEDFSRTYNREALNTERINHQIKQFSKIGPFVEAIMPSLTELNRLTFPRRDNKIKQATFEFLTRTHEYLEKNENLCMKIFRLAEKKFNYKPIEKTESIENFRFLFKYLSDINRLRGQRTSILGRTQAFHHSLLYNISLLFLEQSVIDKDSPTGAVLGYNVFPWSEFKAKFYSSKGFNTLSIPLISDYLEKLFPEDIDAVTAPHLVTSMIFHIINAINSIPSRTNANMFQTYVIPKIIKPLQERNLIKTLTCRMDNKESVIDIINRNIDKYINENKKIEEDIKKNLQNNALYLKYHIISYQLTKTINISRNLEKLYETIIDICADTNTLAAITNYIGNSIFSPEYIETDIIFPLQQKYKDESFLEKLKCIIERLVKNQEIEYRYTVTQNLIIKQVETLIQDDEEQLQKTTPNENLYQKICQNREKDTRSLRILKDELLQAQLREARVKSLTDTLINKFFEIQKTLEPAQKAETINANTINGEINHETQTDNLTETPHKRKLEDPKDDKVNKKARVTTHVSESARKRKMEDPKDAQTNKKAKINDSL